MFRVPPWNAYVKRDAGDCERHLTVITMPRMLGSMKQLGVSALIFALLFMARVGCRAVARGAHNSSTTPHVTAPVTAASDDGYLRFVDPRSGELYAHVPAFEAERAKREYGLILEAEWLANQPVNIQLEHW